MMCFSIRKENYMKNINEYSPQSGRKLRENNTTVNDADFWAGMSGSDGGKYITSASGEVVPDAGYVFTCVCPLEEITITTLTGNISGNMAGVTTNRDIPGRFTAARISAGKAIAYQGI